LLFGILIEAMLYLIPTPVGNLEDITLRAIRLLKECDLVLAEDTRTSGQLLKHLGISKPMASFHIHNEHQKLAGFIRQMKEGKIICLVSDAGTPSISDPGFLLVREVIREGMEVICLPGPTAFVPALVCSGFPTDRFLFEGFLPQKKGRQTRIREMLGADCTLVIYESPHRLLRLLEELEQLGIGERLISVSREISKHFEETLRGTTAELKQHFTEKAPKGEFVICISARQKD
jgi:16S rRNA (cytidine1402-2'-O)-methyltransferase